ncbi:MAG: signal recognition particle-docking protein FtsY [Desulfurococcales archaeon]|nr:signal recognition particle-docking protein FtsY [Desulfurococcales archaeon]
MFNRFRDAIKKTVSSLKERVGEKLQREIKEDDLDEILDEMMMELLEVDVAYEVAESLAEAVKRSLIGLRISRGVDLEALVRKTIEEKLLEILDKPVPDVVREARSREPGERPLVLVFLGVNGVGKTTTIAKMAYMLRQAGVTPVLAAADTFRAGAQEQLAVHAERLGVPLVRGRYGADPASVAHDAISYSRARGYRVVLVDTAGRMHADYDLMGELKKIVRVSKPDYKVLVVDSLTGNDAVEQARRFNEAVGVDFVILTKTDADVKGGTAVSVAGVIGKPIAYLGIGQGYGDLVRFDAKKFVKDLVGA